MVGFDPIWNETFTFNIIMPELALIRFVVMDKDVVSDDYIGQATFPVNSLREGILSAVQGTLNSG